MDLNEAVEEWGKLCSAAMDGDARAAAITEGVVKDLGAFTMGVLVAEVILARAEGREPGDDMDMVRDQFLVLLKAHSTPVERPMGCLPPGEIRDDGHTYMNGVRVD